MADGVGRQIARVTVAQGVGFGSARKNGSRAIRPHRQVIDPMLHEFARRQRVS